jgi:hypothetical protein
VTPELALLTLSLLPWLARREPVTEPAHEHEWERGIHMAEAFGVDGRKYACAICGVVRPADQDLATLYLRSGRLRVWRRKP